jgi:hypothetical protein
LVDCGQAVSRHGLNNQGLSKYRTAYWNLDPAALYEDSLKAGTAELAEGGALVVMTGEHTGRAPKDKFIVDEPSSSDQIWWGEVNARLSEDHFDGLYAKMQAHLAERDLYVQDVYAGADPAYRLAVRVVSESPWHSLFAHNMFLIPSHEERADFAPQFSVLHAPSLTAEPEHDGTNSPVFIVVNLARRLVLIGGSFYAGEHALLGQHRPGRRHGDLLRPLGHRQDDPLCRQYAYADRRRRARLVRERRVQLRGRLLRQGDSPVARGGARDLRHHPALRHHPGERRDGPGEPPARSRRRPLHGEHAGELSY